MNSAATVIPDLSTLVRVGRWTHPPVEAVLSDGTFEVTADEGSDAWRHTSYEFVHDSEHALIAPMRQESAVQVSFVLDYTQQFDQAGLFLRESETEWIKAGVEVSDGAPQLGAVVTHGSSDWSVAPVREWRGRTVTLRASRSGNAVVIRARADGDDWRLVRVAHANPGATISAGLYCAAPTRAGLTVRFTGYESTDPDLALH